jgi:hypothetical protein
MWRDPADQIEGFWGQGVIGLAGRRQGLLGWIIADSFDLITAVLNYLRPLGFLGLAQIGKSCMTC